jgi:predicted dehydrogenase
VARAGIPVQVGFQSRFHPIIRSLREMVVDGRLGRPMGYVVRDDQFWPTGAVIDGHTSWRSQAAEAGGGALLEHSIHSCDIACWLFGPVRRVHALTRNVFGYDVEDTAALSIEHESGVVGTLLTIFNGVQDREERRVEVFFERGAVEATTDFVVGAPEDSLLVKGARGPAERVDVAALLRSTFVRDGVDPDREFFVYQYLAHRAFAAALAASEGPSPDCIDALHAHQLVEAGYRSAAAGAAVEVADLAVIPR